jgi:hypothetical protein
LANSDSRGLKTAIAGQTSGKSTPVFIKAGTESNLLLKVKDLRTSALKAMLQAPASSVKLSLRVLKYSIEIVTK